MNSRSFELSKMLFIIFICGMSAHSCKKTNSATVTNYHPQDTDVNNTVNQDTALERGGSNYPMYSVGNYLSYPTDSDWFIPYNLRPVIGTYHLAPDTVRKQLATMFANGQRKIALDLWYSDFSRDANLVDSPLYGHVVNSKLGKLMPQHEANFRALLGDIQSQGFDEIILRFDTQGDSDPRGWTNWDDSKYQLNWSFISSTKSIVQAVLGKSFKVLYDLDGELGGIFNGQSAQYAQKLWHDYIQAYGSHNTVGFSFAVAPQRLTNAIAIFDKEGKRPDIYAFDIYGDEYNTFAYLKNEMIAAGESQKPVYAEEVFYNDPLSFSQILLARSMLPLNIRFIIQWPLERGATQSNFSIQYPADYSAYIN
jgi:hypothetical protein